jgi:hypothetical protein
VLAPRYSVQNGGGWERRQEDVGITVDPSLVSLLSPFQLSPPLCPLVRRNSRDLVDDISGDADALGRSCR